MDDLIKVTDPLGNVSQCVKNSIEGLVVASVKSTQRPETLFVFLFARLFFKVKPQLTN